MAQANRSTPAAKRATAVAKSKGNGGAPNGKPRRRRARRAPVDIGIEEIKRLAKAPADYQDVAHQFADALEWTKFRGSVTPRKLRSMVDRGKRLAQRAATAQIKATAADRRRMVQESTAWKSMLSTWRLVVAAMPDRPELEQPFAFMQEYMSVERTTTAPVQPVSSGQPQTAATP